MKKVSKMIAEKGYAGAKHILASNMRIVKYTTTLHANSDSSNMYDAYRRWVQNTLPDYTNMHKIKHLQASFSFNPTISILMTVRDDEAEFLAQSLDSVIGQIYEKWELCITAGDSSPQEIIEMLDKYCEQDGRIKFKIPKKKDKQVRALSHEKDMLSGKYVAFLGHGDMLWPNSLYEIVNTLNRDRTIDFMYTDEDQIPADRHDHVAPFFKPDWNPDLLRSINYVACFSVVKKSLYKDVGGRDMGSWDFSLRATKNAKNIHHVSKILYSRRLRIEGSQLAVDDRRALVSDFKDRGYRTPTVSWDGEIWTTTLPVYGNPLISIIIPTKNQYKTVKRCLDSIFNITTYVNFEIVLVDTGSTDKKVLKWYSRITKQHKNVKVVDWHEENFSYSRSCNEGARVASGEVLVMLNNDTEVITPQWLDLLCSEVQRPEIGAAGPLLLYPDGKRIQHAGIGVGLGGFAANMFSKLVLTEPAKRSQHLMINAKRDVTAVTGACLAIRKKVYNEIGGFDEDFRITYNDVDLCLRLVEAGYRNIYVPYVRLKHYESLTLGLPEEVARRDVHEFEAAKKRFVERWNKYIEHDPNININIDKTNALYELK